MSGGARCSAPQKPPRSEPLPGVRLLVPLAADTIRWAALEENFFDINSLLLGTSWFSREVLIIL